MSLPVFLEGGVQLGRARCDPPGPASPPAAVVCRRRSTDPTKGQGLPGWDGVRAANSARLPDAWETTNTPLTLAQRVEDAEDLRVNSG